MGHNWQTGETITAALLNGVAQIGDIGTAGTPTGDALKAAIDAEATALGLATTQQAAGAAAGLALVFGA